VKTLHTYKKPFGVRRSRPRNPILTCGRGMATNKRYSGDNRLIIPENDRLNCLAPRCGSSHPKAIGGLKGSVVHDQQWYVSWV
jgi:hypothetical protein